MSFNFSHIDTSKGLEQIPEAFKILIQTPKFIKEHQLWKGFGDYRWIFIFSVVVAILFSLTLYHDIHNYFVPEQDFMEKFEIPTDGLDKGIEAIDETLAELPTEAKEGLEETKKSLEETKEEFEKSKHKPIFSGSLKFLLLIFLEILIFHFAVKTNNILKNQDKNPEFKDFYKAQIRMILVMGRKWIYGLIMYILVSIVCGITGTDFLKSTIMFFIYGFYMGFAFLDNYLEQYHFSLKQSSKCIQSHFGAATVFGVFASILMNIPLVGPLVVPFICGIAATRYGHISQMESFKMPIQKA